LNSDVLGATVVVPTCPILLDCDIANCNNVLKHNADNKFVLTALIFIERCNYSVL
jgi:hypothetical protein